LVAEQRRVRGAGEVPFRHLGERRRLRGGRHGCGDLSARRFLPWSSGFCREQLVSPDHTGNTTFDGSERITSIYLDRARDLSAVTDALDADALPAPAIAWNGEAVAMGHSFGGYTVYALGGAAYDIDSIEASCADGTGGDVCAQWDDTWRQRFSDASGDARFSGIVAMAPGDYSLFGAEGTAQIGVPTLLMTAELDGENDGDGALYRADGVLRGDRSVLMLGGGHDSFTDFAGKVDTVEETLAPEEGWRIVDAFALAFAWRALGDERFAAVLDGQTIVSDAAVLE
jgi:predicted dienelactone hydrolase